MKKNRFSAKQFALCAVMTALMVVLVYMSSFFPVMSLSIIAIAGVISAILVFECGFYRGLTAYISASLLMLLLVPDKGNAVLFVFLFGIYPVFSKRIESIKKTWIVWFLKIITANILLVLVWNIFKLLFISEIADFQQLIWIVWIAFNVIFVLYDICLKKLIIFYKIRIARHIQ